MKLGTYTYTAVSFTYGWRSFPKYTMRVEVVGESLTQYKVKYLGQHADGSRIGSEHWVNKKKVKLDAAPDTETKPPRDDIRLPYKD